MHSAPGTAITTATATGIVVEVIVRATLNCGVIDSGALTHSLTNYIIICMRMCGVCMCVGVCMNTTLPSSNDPRTGSPCCGVTRHKCRETIYSFVMIPEPERTVNVNDELTE